MSYLDLPRLYFAGRFFANPSTINNKLANYNPDVKLLPHSVGPSRAGVVQEYAGFQYINPYGLANFFLSDCVVTGFHAESGEYHGGPLGTVASGLPYAKLIDLDPDQQSISQLFGLVVRLQMADGAGARGPLEPAGLHDLWYGRAPRAAADQKAAGCFQSLIPADKLDWTSAGPDTLLGALRRRCETGLSVKFMLDAYQPEPTRPDFNYGRVVGVIGPGRAGEPARFPAERRLNSGRSPFGPAYWKLDAPRSRATIDLSNAAPLDEPGGESLRLGRLRAAIPRGDGFEPLDCPPLDYSRAALVRAGGLVDIGLSAGQCRALEGNPLALVAESPDGNLAVGLREDPSMVWVNCDPTWLRLAPGHSATVTFYARRAGVALANATLDLRVTSHGVNNRPRAGVRFPPEFLTDERGEARVTVTAASPQPLPPRRAVADSQVYYVGGSWQAAGELTRQSGGGALSVLVFNDVPQVEHPTWVDHVGPIFTFYARLYPGTASVLDFGSYEGVRKNADFLRGCLQLPVEHPLHFPPSRDLAPKKATMIERWFLMGMPYE